MPLAGDTAHRDLAEKLGEQKEIPLQFFSAFHCTGCRTPETIQLQEVESTSDCIADTLEAQSSSPPCGSAYSYHLVFYGVSTYSEHSILSS